MNNQSAKEILSAYRPDGSDAQDENFKEALEQCRNDPELQVWFSEQVKFDNEIVRKLREVRGPDEGKQAILAYADLASKEKAKPAWRRVVPWVSLAAAAMFIFVITLYNNQGVNSFDGFSADNFSIGQLVNQAMPLEHRSNNRAELINWLEGRNAPVPPQLPDVFDLATAKGCRIFSDGQGGKISLFCFQMDGELVHVLTFDEQTRPYFDQVLNEWWSENELNMIAFEQDQDLYVIATKLPSESLGKYL